jgi:PAS domain S-box-containing protein
MYDLDLSAHVSVTEPLDLAPVTIENEIDLNQSIDKLLFYTQYTQINNEELEIIKQMLDAFHKVCGVCIIDSLLNILYVNDMFCDMRGYSRSELIGRKHIFKSKAFNEDTVGYKQMFDTLNAGRMWQGEIENINKAGETYWVNVRIIPIPDVSGYIKKYISFSFDVTQHVNLLRDANDTLNTIYKFAGDDWTWESDIQHRYISVSAKNIAHELLIGHSRFELSKSIASDDVDWLKHQEELNSRKTFWNFEHPIRIQGHEETIWVSVSGEPFYKNGEFAGYRGICRDVTERRRQIQHFYDLTHLDALTRVPNNNHFKTLIDRRMMAPTTAKEPFALAVFEPDNINRFALTYGTSDLYIQALATRLKACLKPDEQMGRLRDGQFVVMFPSIGREDAAVRVHCILSSCAKINSVDSHYPVRSGIATYPSDAMTPDHLIRLALFALSCAKESPSEHIALFDHQTWVASNRYKTLVNDVQFAINDDHLRLRYQPIIDITTGRVAAFEALMLCQHPTKGEISAVQIVNTMEDPSIASKIGPVVVKKAMQQAADWKANNVPFGALSINVTGPDFTDGNIVRLLKDEVARHNLHPQDFIIELTENINIFKSIGKAATNTIIDGIKELHAHGFAIALDDFGMGYAQMGHLNGDLPFSKMKADKSVVKDITTHDKSFQILKHMVDLAYSLKSDVVAEGVETIEQYAIVKKLGCRFIQGYLFSKPMPSDMVVHFLMHFDFKSKLI